MLEDTNSLDTSQFIEQIVCSGLLGSEESSFWVEYTVLLEDLLEGVSSLTFIDIYILSAFTEQPYSELLGRTVVYISIITLSQATSHDVDSLQSDWMSLTL